MAAHPHSAPTSFATLTMGAQPSSTSTTQQASPFNYSYLSSTQTFAPAGRYYPPQIKREVDPFYASPLPPATFLTQEQPAKKRLTGKKHEGKSPSFLTKLYQILATPEYTSMIRWDDSGSTIVIAQPELLARAVLPSVYRQSRFASFSRQLNIYGFMRKVGHKGERGNTETELSLWTHPDLHRNSTREQILNFKRRVQPRVYTNRGRRARGSLDSNASQTSMSDEVTSPEIFGKLLGEDDEPQPQPRPPASSPPVTVSSFSASSNAFEAGQRFSALPPRAYAQLCLGFEPHSAPATTGAATAAPVNQPRFSYPFPSTYLAPMYTAYAPAPAHATPVSPTPHQEPKFEAPTFSLGDASSWYGCGVAELAPPPPPFPAQAPITPDAAPSPADFVVQLTPSLLSPTEPFEVFAMSPDTFQSHTPLTPYESSPRAMPQPRGFAQSASQRRADKSQPVYHPTWPKQTAGGSGSSSCSPGLLFVHDPLVRSPLRRNSGATFMGTGTDEMDLVEVEPHEQVAPYGACPPLDLGLASV